MDLFVKCRTVALNFTLTLHYIILPEGRPIYFSAVEYWCYVVAVHTR